MDNNEIECLNCIKQNEEKILDWERAHTILI